MKTTPTPTNFQREKVSYRYKIWAGSWVGTRLLSSELIVVAPNEEEAMEKAKKMVKRNEYILMTVEENL